MNTKAPGFIKILLPFMSGILLFYNRESFYGQSLFVWTLVLCSVLFTFLLITNILYKRLRLYRYKKRNGFIFYLFLFLFGGFWCLMYNELPAEDHYSKKTGHFLKIAVNEAPNVKNSICRFRAKVLCGYDSSYGSGEKLTGSLMVVIVTDSLNPLVLNYGDELIIPFKISAIKSPDQISAFNYKAWLAAQNIYHQAFIAQSELVKLTGNSGNRLIAYTLGLRKQQVDFYRRIIKNDEAFSVAATLILGYRADLDKETLNIYSKTGTIHALSVSGMHVGLVYLVLNWLLQFMNRRRWQGYFKLGLILTSIWFYALLTGFSPSVLRSVIMLSVFIIAKIFARNPGGFNILAFAAFCLLVYNPFMIWDIGFQLSFLAVAGLIWIQPMIQNWWQPEPDWMNKIWGVVAMSLAAQLATFPFSLYYFHQFPVYFLISNLFILLPVALLMYLGIFVLLFRLEMLGPVFEWLINFTNSGLGQIAGLPFASLADIWINKFELAVLCLGITLFIFACSEYKKQLLFASFICLLIFQSSFTYRKLKYSKLAKNWKLSVYLNRK